MQTPRGVAQSGSALGWGPSGRRFKSCLPDVDNKFRRVCNYRGMADPAEEKAELQVVVAQAIEKRIFVVRERQVMLDEDLADLYGVETKRLIQQVKRN
jgi:hypothetical protein